MEATATRLVYRLEGWALCHFRATEHILNLRSWREYANARGNKELAKAMSTGSYCGVVCNSEAARDSFTQRHDDLLKVTSVRETLTSYLSWTRDEVTQGGFYGCE
jgi:hypothetical protein